MPKTVLGGDIALRNEEVVLRGGVNVRNAARVAAHGDGRGKAGKMDFAIELRQSGFRHGMEPQHAHPGSDEEQSEQAAAGPEQDARPAAFAQRARRGLGRRKSR